MKHRVLVMCLAPLVDVPLAALPVAAHHMDNPGSVLDGDGGDEHLLCRPQDCSTEINTGNVVGVWQIILWSETYLAACGSSGVDGIFGTATKNATISLQDYWNMTADGKVGSGTWGRADSNLVWVDFPNLKETGYEADRTSEVIDFYRPYPNTIIKVAGKTRCGETQTTTTHLPINADLLAELIAS